MIPLTFLGERSEFLRNVGIKGVGFTPAFLVLIIYALFPIVHNTIAGLKMVDQNLLEVARGMGMKHNQAFWKVQLPLSLPVILGGIRTAMTQSIGNTILAGLIGGGGLGSIIFLGLAQAAPDLILLGIIPLIAMAFMLDSMLSFVIFFYRKKYLGIK
jgi:osmoprotectant transport system permease protein